MEKEETVRYISYAFVLSIFLFIISVGLLSIYGINLMTPLFILGLGAFAAYMALQWHAGKQMQIRLDQSVFFAGDDITGTVILHLGKEKKARGLHLVFTGIQRSGDSTMLLFRKKHLLHPARTFMRGQAFRFSIPMPTEVKHILNVPPPTTAHEKHAAYYAGPPTFFISAYLDLPHEIDISQSIEVKIVRGKKDHEP